MSKDTLFVEFLRAGGCTPNQAVAFERCLEDHPMCGVSPRQLTAAIRSYNVLQICRYVDILKEQELQIKILRDQLHEFTKLEMQGNMF